VIIGMLRSPPQPRPKDTAPSSGQPLHTLTSGAQSQAPAHPSAGPVAEACEKFLELPGPVVLVVLWLVGALLLGLVLGSFLGTVLAASYWTELWLSAAVAQP
jgi:hypothetical protein